MESEDFFRVITEFEFICEDIGEIKEQIDLTKSEVHKISQAINSIENADQQADSTTRQLISQTFLAIALQANVLSEDALQLLNVPTVSEQSASSNPLFEIATSLREFLSLD